MNKLSGMLLAVLLLAVANAWGACKYIDSQTFTSCRGSNFIWCDPKSNCTNACNNYCHFTCLEPYVPSGANRYYIGTDCWFTTASAKDACGNFPGTGTCGQTDSWIRGTSCHGYECDTKCEADSLACFQNGGTWTNTGASTCDGKSCKMPVCKQADTQWLDSAKAACTALGGENNFAITEVGETCVHSGTCCTASDSIPVGNTCKWRCDSVLTTCNGRTGDLFGGVLPDTSVSGQDTTFSYQCYYNCSHSPNPDSTVYLVEGNIVLSGPSDSIPDGIKSGTFNSVRTTTGGVYIYDYLSPAASEYIDSIAAMKCVEHLWRCVINSKYVYWYDNQEVPAGCTNIVRVK